MDPLVLLAYVSIPVGLGLIGGVCLYCVLDYESSNPPRKLTYVHRMLGDGGDA